MLTAAMLMVLSYFDIFMLSYFRTSGESGATTWCIRLRNC